MPQNENANFHARKRIILKTKAQILKFITANETPNARKRKHANGILKAHTYKKRFVHSICRLVQDVILVNHAAITC